MACCSGRAPARALRPAPDPPPLLLCHTLQRRPGPPPPAAMAAPVLCQQLPRAPHPQRSTRPATLNTRNGSMRIHADPCSNGSMIHDDHSQTSVHGRTCVWPAAAPRAPSCAPPRPPPASPAAPPPRAWPVSWAAIMDGSDPAAITIRTGLGRLSGAGEGAGFAPRAPRRRAAVHVWPFPPSSSAAALFPPAAAVTGPCPEPPAAPHPGTRAAAAPAWWAHQAGRTHNLARRACAL